jgi:hypothetical protein
VHAKTTTSYDTVENALSTRKKFVGQTCSDDGEKKDDREDGWFGVSCQFLSSPLPKLEISELYNPFTDAHSGSPTYEIATKNGSIVKVYGRPLLHWN